MAGLVSVILVLPVHGVQLNPLNVLRVQPGNTVGPVGARALAVVVANIG